MTPPHVTLSAVRRQSFTLDQLRERMAELGYEVTIGALSAIENGHRGASTQMLEGIAKALDLDPSDISTNYEPKRWRTGTAA